MRKKYKQHYRQPIRRDLRMHLRWQPCVVCGMVDKHGNEPDHIVPVSRGGYSSEENLQSMCRYHNGVKGARYTTEEVIDHFKAGRFRIYRGAEYCAK